MDEPTIVQPPKPTAGRVVLFTLESGEVRPAFIVRVWSATCVNLRVFFDGSNDSEYAQYPDGWVTSVLYDDPYAGIGEPGSVIAPYYKPRTWHWPPRI